MKVICVLALLLFACGDSDSDTESDATVASDARTTDASTAPDAPASPDSATPPADGATEDSGSSDSAVAVDANSPTDAGDGSDASTPSDAGSLPSVGRDPRTSANVYWVGHSLMSQRDRDFPESRTILELVGDFARSEGQTYDHFKHTIPGAPLSWNWNEAPPDLRTELENNLGNYDVMVLTEGISIEQTLEWHHSAFFAQRFYCSLMNANPNAEIYLYESWHHLYASDPDLHYPPPHTWDFHANLREDIPLWESILDDVLRTDLPNPPNPVHQFAGANCTPNRPMYRIPVGTALAALIDRIEAPRPGDDFDGFTEHHFVQNGYADWPEDWPVPPEQADSIDPDPIIAGLTLLRDPPADDVHASQLGVYFTSLVHYAVVYRRSPIGLPAVNGASESLARIMQEVVWEVVTSDPRSGVLQR